jgi:UDP-N-acetyl-D-glucosamine dehydrogenase
MSIQSNTANPAAAAAIVLGTRVDEKGSATEAVRRIESREATIGVVGIGYVGLPLAMAAARVGFRTTGFDLDPHKPALLNSGHSYIGTISSEEVSSHVEAGRFHATDDFSGLAGCDVILICVPTPLTRQREPDLSHVEATARIVARHLQPGQLIVLESTTYPGTTREVIKPILEQGELRSGVDFFLGFSPEREDPGNPDFATVTIPKVVAGDGPDASQVVEAFYGAVMDRIVPVSSLDVAEAVKITENVFRAVNIALVNELKMVFERMGIDVWEVIEAAKSKPFGYMAFYPGPGLGGHCIPIDPFYLTWKSREYEMPTRFIELAGEINIAMPRYVIGKLEEALDRRASKSLGAARVLILGLSYKKNVADIRESPSFKLIELLESRGVAVDYHDPHVPTVPETREHLALHGRASVPLEAAVLSSYDAVVIATDHDAVDYKLVAQWAPLVIDTRNACARAGVVSGNVVKA